MPDNNLIISPIGVLHSPFKEKFGLPRQANLIKSCSASIKLYAPYNSVDAFKGLDSFTDIWLIFGFHQNNQENWKALVRPPRLGGNKKVGVFASRSPFRPNGLGISRVNLLEVINDNNKINLRISCPDIVDGTPIYDIKPYIHYADSNPHAKCGFAVDEPRAKLSVVFSERAEEIIQSLTKKHYPNLKEILRETIELDPRPAYKKIDDKKVYGIRLYDLNITWNVNNDIALVILIEKFGF